MNEYRVDFEHIGRKYNLLPLSCWAKGPDDLANRVCMMVAAHYLPGKQVEIELRIANGGRMMAIGFTPDPEGASGGDGIIYSNGRRTGLFTWTRIS